MKQCGTLVIGRRFVSAWARHGRIVGAGAAFCLLFSLAMPACAIIRADGDGTGNNTAPEDDPGWANIGRNGSVSGFNGGTGVYLGNRWVLTAKHAGTNGTNFPGGSVASTGDFFQLKNPVDTGDELSEYTDLMLYRLASDPGLPSIPISSTTIPNGAAVTMIGHGINRETNRTYWDITESPTGTWNWTEVTEFDDYEKIGFQTTSTNSRRWGTNTIVDASSGSGHTVVVDAGELGDVIAIVTQFNDLTNEAQPVSRDSGGAVFYKNGDQWELGGTILYVDPGPAPGGIENPNFPGASSNAIFGYLAFHADLSQYRDQMLPLINPLPGDMNVNGVLDDDDITQFVKALTDPEAYLADFPYIELEDYSDIDGSGTLDLGDVKPFIALFPNFAGLEGGLSLGVAAPEPASIGLIFVGVLSSLLLFGRRIRRF